MQKKVLPMPEISTLALALPSMLGLATLAWLMSLSLRDTSIVDSFWSLFFVAALFCWLPPLEQLGPRAILVSTLIMLWALRLSVYLTVRNWGKPEDRRYQTIRARNQPHYWIKSLFYVFYLQVGLAFIVSLPILPAVTSELPLSVLDGLGTLIFATGFLTETLADWQLARFKATSRQKGGVMDQGLWHYSRHPNYFGEALLWWGFGVMAVAAGAPLWILVSPIFMTFLLLKVSGVPLLEADLSGRHPNYRRYIETTSAFWPRRPTQR